MLGDLGKLIVAKGFKKLPKVQKIARSGHTEFAICRFKERYKTICRIERVVYKIWSLTGPAFPIGDVA